MSHNPILAEIIRAGIVESFHRGSVAICSSAGETIYSNGNVKNHVFPRSAIKALQALPLVQSGAAAAFGLNGKEISVACASHGGEKVHVDTVRSILRKAGLEEEALLCGSHWPLYAPAAREIAAKKEIATSVHNNCSGKHAGMLATAKHLGEPLADYVNRKHPVQQRIEAVISEFCDTSLEEAPCGTDGCSVPTWALPLDAMALGFARFSVSSNNHSAWGNSCSTIIDAVRHQPMLVAGSDRFCTKIMTAVPRLFAKTGAEGVYCGCVPHAGIGITVKCDDGASRAAEVIFAKALASLDIWHEDEKHLLLEHSQSDLKNHNGIIVGQLRAC